MYTQCQRQYPHHVQCYMCARCNMYGPKVTTVLYLKNTYRKTIAQWRSHCATQTLLRWCRLGHCATQSAQYFCIVQPHCAEKAAFHCAQPLRAMTAHNERTMVSRRQHNTKTMRAHNEAHNASAQWKRTMSAQWLLHDFFLNTIQYIKPNTLHEY